MHMQNSGRNSSLTEKNKTLNHLKHIVKPYDDADIAVFLSFSSSQMHSDNHFSVGPSLLTEAAYSGSGLPDLLFEAVIDIVERRWHT